MDTTCQTYTTPFWGPCTLCFQNFSRANEEEKLVNEEKDLTLQLYDAQLGAMDEALAQAIEEKCKYEADITILESRIEEMTVAAGE